MTRFTEKLAVVSTVPLNDVINRTFTDYTYARGFTRGNMVFTENVEKFHYR